MLDLKVTVKFDGLPAFREGLYRAIAKGIERGVEVVQAHMRDDHDQDAHSKGRFQTRSGRLIQGIRIMPVSESGGEIHGGVISIADYSLYVEEGHDIVHDGKVVGHAPAYSFMKAAIEDEAVQQEFFECVAYEVEEYLN